MLKLPIVKLVIEALPEENVLIEPEVANKLPILTILVTFNLPPNVESPVTVKPPPVTLKPPAPVTSNGLLSAVVTVALPLKVACELNVGAPVMIKLPTVKLVIEASAADTLPLTCKLPVVIEFTPL